MSAGAKHAARGYETVLREMQVASTGGACPVCTIKLTAGNQASDHCHGSGLARGTLCRTCNSGEGVLRERGDTAALQHFERVAPASRYTKAPMRPAARLRALGQYVAGWAAVHSTVAPYLEPGDLSPKLGARLALDHSLDYLMRQLTKEPATADLWARRGVYILPSGQAADVAATVRAYIAGRLRLAGAVAQ